jgi:hypothetical protein
MMAIVVASYRSSNAALPDQRAVEICVVDVA